MQCSFDMFYTHARLLLDGTLMMMMMMAMMRMMMMVVMMMMMMILILMIRVMIVVMDDVAMQHPELAMKWPMLGARYNAPTMSCAVVSALSLKAFVAPFIHFLLLQLAEIT